VLNDVSDTLVAVIIDGGAHHLDFKYDNPNDPQSAIDARNFEMRTYKNGCWNTIKETISEL
ncbi:hypothetical protein CEXT_21041, partial [Caerostris extrusa]